MNRERSVATTLFFRISERELRIDCSCSVNSFSQATGFVCRAARRHGLCPAGVAAAGDRIGQLVHSAGQIFEQYCHCGVLLRPYRLDLGDLGIAEPDFTSYVDQRPPLMPSVTAPAVCSPEVRPPGSYGNGNYNQSNYCPKSFAFHWYTSQCVCLSA